MHSGRSINIFRISVKSDLNNSLDSTVYSAESDRVNGVLVESDGVWQSVEKSGGVWRSLAESSEVQRSLADSSGV